MKCTHCGAEQFSTVYEDSPLLGLPHILLEGLKKKVCDACGEYRKYIPHHEAMTLRVTVALLNKRRQLASAEIKWLRARLGITSAQLGQLLKVSATTVSYWENGHRTPSHASDLLLRLLVSTTVGEGSFSFHAGLQVTDESNEPLQMRLYFDDGDWRCRGVSDEELLIADLAEPGWGSWSTPAWLASLQGVEPDDLLQK